MAFSPGGSRTQIERDVPPTEGADDYALMAAIASRDPDALAVLYDLHSPTLLALCTRVLRDRAAAEELLVEIFQEVWEHAGRFDATRGAPGAYLVTLARSRAIDRLRMRARQRSAAPVGGVGVAGGSGKGGAIADPADNSAGPLDRVLLDERGRTVRAALARLDPLQREAIEFAFYDGLSHSEVAERLAKPLGTVKSGIRRGLLKLRDLLVDERAHSMAGGGSAAAGEGKS
jgi:RNA polymerase sigma-70 factor (ECF subfamily)